MDHSNQPSGIHDFDFLLVPYTIRNRRRTASVCSLSPSPSRSCFLACLAAAVGGIGMALITRTPLYAITAVVSAVSGAVLSQHEVAWRHGWLVVLLAAGIATLLGVRDLR